MNPRTFDATSSCVAFSRSSLRLPQFCFGRVQALLRFRFCRIQLVGRQVRQNHRLRRFLHRRRFHGRCRHNTRPGWSAARSRQPAAASPRSPSRGPARLPAFRSPHRSASADVPARFPSCAPSAGFFVKQPPHHTTHAHNASKNVFGPMFIFPMVPRVAFLGLLTRPAATRCETSFPGPPPK